MIFELDILADRLRESDFFDCPATDVTLGPYPWDPEALSVYIRSDEGWWTECWVFEDIREAGDLARSYAAEMCLDEITEDLFHARWGKPFGEICAGASQEQREEAEDNLSWAASEAESVIDRARSVAEFIAGAVPDVLETARVKRWHSVEPVWLALLDENKWSSRIGDDGRLFISVSAEDADARIAPGPDTTVEVAFSCREGMFSEAIDRSLELEPVSYLTDLALKSPVLRCPRLKAAGHENVIEADWIQMMETAKAEGRELEVLREFCTAKAIDARMTELIERLGDIAKSLEGDANA